MVIVDIVSVDIVSVDIVRNHIGHTRWHTVCRRADVGYSIDSSAPPVNPANASAAWARST
jgi:hypothetical protein